MTYIAKNSDEQKPEGAPMDQLSPKFMLVAGMALSVMAICTVGFVILLWLVIR